MATDILTRIIDIGINRKLEKLEQSSNRHNTDIVFCENLVEEINKLFNQLNINYPEEESKEKENLCIYYSVDDNLNEKSFASSKTSIQHNNSVLQHLHKEEPKKRAHHKVQSMAYNSTRTEKTPMRSTPKNTNNSSKKDNLTDKKNSTKQENANVSTPSTLDKKETKRYIKPKPVSQDMTITPEINLKKKNFVGNLNGQFATNAKDKIMKKEKSFVIKNESENYKTGKVKSLTSEGSTKKIESKSRAKTPKASSVNETEKKFTNIKPFTKTNSQVNVLSPDKKNKISRKDFNSPDKSNEKTLKKNFTSASKFKDKFSKDYNTTSTNKKETNKNEENLEEKSCPTPLINSDINNNINQNIQEIKPKLNTNLDTNNFNKRQDENSIIKIVSNLASSDDLRKEGSLKHLSDNKDKGMINRKEKFPENKKLSLREIFCIEFENISKFLNKYDLLTLRISNKLLCATINKEFNKNLQYQISLFSDKLNQLIEKNPLSELTKEVPSFILTRGTIKAIELLNESIYTKLFLQSATPSEDILFPYKIYFQFLKSPILKSLPNEALFWMECCKFFLNDTNGKAGDFINNSVKNFDFSEENIYIISKLCENKEKKISPQFFSKVCGTTGLIIFLIRDALEYTGIIIDKKTLPGRLYRLYKYGQEKITNNHEHFKKFHNQYLSEEEKIKDPFSKDFSIKEGSPINKNIDIISSSILQKLSPIRRDSIQKENNEHHIDLRFINTSLESETLANSILTPTQKSSKKELEKILQYPAESIKKECNNNISDKQTTFDSNEKIENKNDKEITIQKSNEAITNSNLIEQQYKSLEKTSQKLEENLNISYKKDSNTISLDNSSPQNKDNIYIINEKNEDKSNEKNIDLETKNSNDKIPNNLVSSQQTSQIISKEDNVLITMTSNNNESNISNTMKSPSNSMGVLKSPLEDGNNK